MRYAQRETTPTPANACESGLGCSCAASGLFRSLARAEAQDRRRRRSRSGKYARSHARESFSPAQLAESLHVMQATDLREISRAASDQPVYSSISVRVKNPARFKPSKTPSRRWASPLSRFSTRAAACEQFFKVLDVFLGIFGSLALAVASIGIVNTLVMAILERRREIGIMKAIGASDGDVKKLFFAEAGAMGILGGDRGRRARLGHRPGDQLRTNIYLRRQSLPPDNFWAVPWWLVFVRNRLRIRGQPDFRPVSRGTRRPARSGAGAALRVN